MYKPDGEIKVLTAEAAAEIKMNVTEWVAKTVNMCKTNMHQYKR